MSTTRPTSAQLYNAAVLMALAEGTADHSARSQQFMALFEKARWWTRLASAMRIVAWRYSPTGRAMRGSSN